METVRRVRAGLLAEGFAATTLIGFAGAPFTVACYMVEGRGSKRLRRGARPGLQRARAVRPADGHPDGGDYRVSRDQADAGAEALMLFDSWAGVLSPSQFRAHVIEPVGRIVACAAGAASGRAGDRVSAAGGGDARRLRPRDRGRRGWRG